ncbi:hypothetical protein A7U60_g5812 [Sanghuangporus baumii]|uniref:Uncharacterized protein n=1 Tax=Sanghuangporus baumii TaxID=108892 RepID=A0A9Q5N2Z0_SANBA|nr:hypothetical protein A7U60_g5812 [Sanghuangporus baumii]
MSRSNKLLYTARAGSEQVLTPRTPRSRAGRAEEALFDADGDENIQFANYYEMDGVHQRAPLLASSASTTFPQRRLAGTSKAKLFKADFDGVGVDWDLIARRLPLLAGLASVLFLAILVIMSVEKPETLHTYLHGSPSPTSHANTSHTMAILSYENYTSFPLTPLEYRQECYKFLAGMKGPMGTYWHIPPGGPMDVEHKEDSRVCKSTITYMLDGYVGLAADLALMAQVAGLAREVINSRTALFHFGHHFMDEFEDPYARELRRAKPIFQRSATSFAHTIRPNAVNAELIQAARREIGAPYLAAHVRHGDRKTEGWEFHGGYVPLGDYVEAVSDTWERVERMDLEDATEPVVWIASDDPDARDDLVKRLTDPDGVNVTRVYSLATSDNEELRDIASPEPYVQPEFNAIPPEDRIRLTRGAVVDLALVSGLWSWDDQTIQTGQKARLEGVVCTISSNFCKLSAVGLGWERAFGFLPGDSDKQAMAMDDNRKRWVELDLKGAVTPVWRAFELF